MWLVVGGIALLAAGATVGATVLTRTDTSGASTAAAVPKGPPELDLDLGVRTDPEAVALRRALTLYDKGKRKQAEAIFSRYGSLQAKIGAAVAEWPNGFDRLAAIAAEHPGSSLAQLELGLSFFQQDRVAQAETAWKKARRLEPDTSYAIRAEDLLHPSYFAGHPPFSPSFSAPAKLATLSRPQQFAFLAAQARKPDAHAKLLYGAALQKLGHAVSAEREFQAAAKLAPHDADAQVAAAVGRFDKANLSASFSRLGPLAKVFPKAPVVRFHLGLMLLWIGQVQAGKAQLEKVVAAGPSPFFSDAQLLLQKIPAK
jgi:tetratricopeptide (TPR) repeat protein